METANKWNRRYFLEYLCRQLFCTLFQRITENIVENVIDCCDYYTSWTQLRRDVFQELFLPYKKARTADKNYVNVISQWNYLKFNLILRF